MPANKKSPQHQCLRFEFSEERGSAVGPLLVVLVLLIGVLGLVIINRQNINDWWKLRGYNPPADIVMLANEDTMSPYTRHLFYLNRPELLPTVASFRTYCPENLNTIVLGCYHSGENGIYIYNVQDPTLYGVQQVTAAHEVLHAVYARLSSKERIYVDGLLENYYLHDLTNTQVIAEVKLYKQTEPTDVMDEMDSTFGTEIASLPAPLEAYYRQFFTNRMAIVDYEQQYDAEFTSRLNTINNDDQQLATLQQNINNEESDLSSQLSNINIQRSQMNALANSGQTETYNSEVPAFNSDVESYNSGVDTLMSNIAAYNNLVDARNLIAGEVTTLDQAIDTRLTTQPTK
jgi:uncharacterized protein YukE